MRLPIGMHCERTELPTRSTGTANCSHASEARAHSMQSAGEFACHPVQTSRLRLQTYGCARRDAAMPGGTGHHHSAASNRWVLLFRLAGALLVAFAFSRMRTWPVLLSVMQKTV